MATTPRPLSWLTKVSRGVYLYRPTPAPSAPAPTSSASSAPKLILLATWMGAAPSHIAKYAEPYRKLYPTSPILVVRSEASDFWWPPTAAKEVAAAAGVLRATFPEIEKGLIGNGTKDATNGSAASANGAAAGPASPELLIHAWSNGGSTMLWRIRALLPSMPKYTLVLDSTPGQFSYKATFTAFSLTLKHPWLRVLLAPALHALCISFWLVAARDRLLDWVTGKHTPRGPLAVSAAAHNDPRWRNAEARRTYIYSDEDVLIPSRDVEEHAAAAKMRGFTVRTEKFKGTAHVAHARYEPERYWRLATETWGGNGVEDEAGNTEEGEEPKAEVEVEVVKLTPETETATAAAPA